MGQPHKHAEIIKAKADGKNIQERRVIGEWHDMEEDDWIFDDNFEYRIKPEPPKSYVTQLPFSDAAPNVDYSKLKSVSIGGIEFVPAAMLEKVADEVASIMAMQAAERTPGPNGYPLMQAEIESIAASARIQNRRILGAIIAKVKEGK